MPSNSGNLNSEPVVHGQAMPPAGQIKPPSGFTGNVMAGGVAAFVAVVLMGIAKHQGYDLQAIADVWVPPPGSVPVQPLIAGAVAFVVSGTVPMTVKQFLSRINDQVIHAARVSADSPASSPPGGKSLPDPAPKV